MVLGERTERLAPVSSPSEIIRRTSLSSAFPLADNWRYRLASSFLLGDVNLKRKGSGLRVPRGLGRFSESNPRVCYEEFRMSRDCFCFLNGPSP